MKFGKLFDDFCKAASNFFNSLDINDDAETGISNRFNISTGRLESIFSTGSSSYSPNINLTTGKVEFGPRINIGSGMSMNPMNGQISLKL